MKRCVQLVLVAAFFFGAVSSNAVVLPTWISGSTDVNLGTSWNGGSVPSDLVFDASTVTGVSVTANLTANSMSFTGSFPAYVFSTANASILNVGSGGITVNSGGAATVTFNSSLAITPTANQTWTAGSAATLIVNGVVSSANALTKAGGGTLVLGGANTYTGATTISSGYISIAADSGLGTAPASATAGHLTLNGGSLATSATMTLNANRGIAVGATGGAFDIANGTTLTYGGVIAGSGALALNPVGGALVLTGANTYSGTFSNFGSILQIGNGGTTGSLDSNIANGGSLVFNRSNALTYAGVISGGGTIAKQGAGQLTLTGANTSNGAVTISAGTLALGTGGAVDPATVINLSPGANTTATFSLAGGQSQTIAALNFSGVDVTSVSNVTLGTGTLTLGGDVTYSTTESNNPGAATISGGTLALNATRYFNIGDSTSTTTELTVSSPISGTGFGLNKIGTGTLALTGANTYTGATKISNGVLSVSTLADGGTNSGLGASTNAANNLLLDGGALRYTGPTASTDRQFLITPGFPAILDASGTGALTFSNTGTIVYSGANTATTLTLTGSNTGANTLNLVLGDNGTAANSLLKKGAGTWVLGGSNTYVGGTSITGGTLTDGKAGAFSPNSSVSISSGGTLAVAFDETIGQISGTTTSAITLANTKTLSLTGGSFDGVISGQGALSLSNGSLTLTNANTYSGGTTVGASGTLILGQGSETLGGIAGTVNLTAANSVFEFNRNDDVTIGNVISGSGQVRKTGNGTVTLSGANTYTGQTTIQKGAIAIASDGALGTAPATPTGGSLFLNCGGLLQTTASLTLSANRSITIGSSGGGLAPATGTTLTYGGMVSGTGEFIKAGAGTLVLTGSVTTSGESPLTMINAGTLQIGAGGTAGFLSGDVENDGTLAFNRSDSVMFSGNIGGSGGIVKMGAGTLTLAGTGSSFDGPVVIQAGTLAVNSIQPIDYYSSLGSGNNDGHIVIGSGATGATLRYTGFVNSNTDRPIDLAGTTGGATLDMFGTGGVNFQGAVTASGAGSKTLTLTGNSFSSTSTISGAIADNSVTNKTSILKTGFGTWALAGANTFTGGVTINNGTLRLGGANTLGSNNVVVNATGGGFNATLDVHGTTQSIGSLTLGGAGGPVSNNVTLGYGYLGLSGNVTYDATNNPLGSEISKATLSSGSFPFGGNLNLGGSTRTFSVGDSNRATQDLTILASITSSDGEGLVKTGAGTLVLGGESTYAGGTVVQAGSGVLLLASSSHLNEDNVTVHDGPLGTGALTLQTGTTLAPTGIFTLYDSYTSDIKLHNAVSFADNVTFGRFNDDGQRLELAGTVTATAATSTLHLLSDESVRFSGTLTGATSGTALTIDSGANTERTLGVVTGTLGANLGSLTVSHAGVIFATPGSLANSTAIKVTNGGYVGVGYDGGTPPAAADLLARIAPADRTAFNGTLGFDTNEEYYYPHAFNGALDFSGFGPNATIGSLSSAILTGTITPSASGYAFGNGGGALVVTSNLADVGGATNASVISLATVPHNALNVIFRGNNTYTGNLTVTNSSAILDSASALPTGRTFNLGANGYVSYTEAFTPATSFSTFVGRLGTYTPTSILGIDSHDFIEAQTYPTEGYYYYRFVTEPLNLSALNPIYLGTATNLTIAGRILAPTGGNLALTAIDGSYLRVETPLRSPDVTSVSIGLVDKVHDQGTVTLVGRNTYAGGTTLFNGSLYLEGSTRRTAAGAILSSPLGTGAFNVASTASNATLLTDSEDEMVLHNPFALGTRLQIGDASYFEGGGDAEWYPSFSRLVLNGVVSDLAGSPGGLDVYADLTLNAANTFTGGVSLHQGTLSLGTNTALGTGTLTLQPFDYGDVGLRTTGGNRTLANAVVLNAFNETAFDFGGRGAFVLNGPVTLNGDAYFELGNYPVTINGNIGTTGFGSVTASGYSALVINGAGNTYNGGTYADYGAIIFGSAASIPASPFSGLSSSYYGYIGVASPTFATNVQTDFINRFDKEQTYGSIGFDTAPGAATNTFSGAISLAGFTSDARLGSATSAVLTGTITPQDLSGYQFGGGGGLLQVNSNLTNNGESLRGVYVYSTPYDPLTLRLGGSNSYSAGTQASNSAVIFKAGAQPSSGSVYLYGGAYAGTEATNSEEVGQFLASLSSGASGLPVVGFDSFSGSYAMNSALTWPTLDGTAPFLGTATSANISGALTIPAGQNVYRFTGYKGGQLTVSSTLIDAGKPMSLQVGDTNSPATFRAPTDPNGILSTVTLTGANTYSGDTTLSAGRLMIGSSSVVDGGIISGPIGKGSLFVSSGGYYASELDLPPATLGATLSFANLANPIRLGSTLVVGGSGSSSFTLSGAISDWGEFSPGYAPQLYKTGTNTVTLSGNNTFSGGIYIAEGTVAFNSATAMGTGPLLLGGPLGPTATFNVSMTLNGISGDNSTDLINMGSGTTLTINQQSDAQYLGTFSSSSASLVFQGPTPSSPAALRLLGASSYNGGTQIQGGIAVIASNNNAFGSGGVANNVVTLNGGRLFVDSGVTLSNSLVLTSGLLGGMGTVQPPATLHVAGAGGNVVILGPGFADNPGTLQFTNVNAALGSNAVLSLDGGGSYRWQFADAANPTGGWDKISVTGTVNITANAATPFNFKIVPIESTSLASMVANFNPSLEYSWSVLAATSITGFSANAFTVDASAFGSSLGIGTFNFTVSGGNTLLLNFSPVPEPSTYVLFASGLGFLGFAIRRRRQARR